MYKLYYYDMFSSSQNPMYAAPIQIAVVDYEMPKDRPFKCDAAGEIM